MLTASLYVLIIDMATCFFRKQGRGEMCIRETEELGREGEKKNREEGYEKVREYVHFVQNIILQ